MANWDKQYTANSVKADIARSLCFATLKSDDIDNREKLTNTLETLVDEQIELERANTKIQKGKSSIRGMWLGAAVTWAGWFIGSIIKAKLNKK